MSSCPRAISCRPRQRVGAGVWYGIREQGECRTCLINAAGDDLEIQALSCPYGADLEHWNAGVQNNLTCINRIIELLW